MNGLEEVICIVGTCNVHGTVDLMGCDWDADMFEPWPETGWEGK